MSTPSTHTLHRPDPTQRVRIARAPSSLSPGAHKNWLVALGSQRVHMVLGSGF